MQFIDFKTLLYSDTLIPDIFINEYLPALKSEYVKIYIYCVFLVGKNRTPSVDDLAKILDLPSETVKKGLLYMSNLKILSWSEEGVVINDLKELEINRFYRPKTTSTPEEVAARNSLNVRRNQVITAINDTFFSGIMSPTWYGDIDLWFEQYGFEEDVMLLLFRHCRDNGSLKKNYIAKVAESMYLKGVKNSHDFDQYVLEFQAMKTVGEQIRKKLGIRKLNAYHEEYVDKWVNRFGFSFDIIEIVLKRTADKPDAAFSYFDTILTDWHARNLNTPAKIMAYIKRYNLQYTAPGQKAGTAGAGGSYVRAYFQRRSGQREYSEEELDKFVSNEFGMTYSEAVTTNGIAGVTNKIAGVTNGADVASGAAEAKSENAAEIYNEDEKANE